MRDSMDVLTNLDLSGSIIGEYTGTDGTWYGTNTTYPANEMPMYSFYIPQIGTGKISLHSIVLPAGLISIGNIAFEYCSGLTSVTFPVGLTSIGKAAFAYCSGLTSVTFLSGLISIRELAFHQCSGLTSITFPVSLTSIGDDAFSGCSGLTSITNLNPNPITIGGSVFEGVDKTACTLKVPVGSKALYEAAPVWKDFLIEEEGYIVTVTVNNSLYGTVTGGGNYAYNTTATLTATANQDYVFENWTNNGNVISSTNPLIFTVTKDTTITANFIPDVGITGANDAINAIVVYPNPVQDKLHLKGLSGKEDIIISDISGRTLYRGKSDGATEMQIPVDHLASGMYFVRISTTTATKTVKLIKN
jgi:hypothetical protein